jgi:Arc/MetJ family transcription regulator
MIYIMKRTQLYLDDELWTALHTRARQERTTVSELVRTAARDRYLGDFEERHAAMEGIVGLWRNRTDLADTDAYIRNLRKGTRMKRLGAE